MNYWNNLKSASRGRFRIKAIQERSIEVIPVIQQRPQRCQKTDGPPSTTSGTKMLLQCCALGVTMSWDDGFLGARASRPHQAWHSLGHLPHLDQPATAPWLSFGLADAVPADRVAACSIALKLSGGQRDSMRAGRPRSQGNHSPLEGESQKPSRQAKADAVGGVWRATSQKADVHPLGNSRLPASHAPALPCGSCEEKRPIVNEDEPRMDTKRHEETRRDTKTDGTPSTTSGAKMHLQFCDLGVTMSWDDGLLGARASRPHQAWHSLGHLPHLDQPGTAPWPSFGLADGVPAHRVAACSIALKLSGGQRNRMRAGRPRSQGNHSPLEGESQKPSRQAKADAVGGVWRATSQKADVHPLGNSRLPASRAPALPRGSCESDTTDPFGLLGTRTMSR